MNIKQKILLLLVLSILLSVICGAIVFANTENKSNSNSILTYKKISSIDACYKEIEEDYLNSEDINNKFDLSIIEQFESDEEKNTENSISNIKFYNNELDSITEAIIETNDKIIKFNADTKEFISYIDLNSECKACDYDNDTIEKEAKEIFETLDIIKNKESYVFIELTNFDEGIWFAQFAKQYDGIINLGESVKFSFSPITKEIISIGKKDIQYENNEVIIKEEEAKSIAKKIYDEKILDTDIEIVIPNYELSNDTGIYKKINRARKAYVFTYDDNTKTRIFIDVTTGEAIGCSKTLGGEM